MIAYQVERWSEIVEELKACFPAHWQEVAMNRDTIPLDPDYDKYAELDAAGNLHCLTVRKDRELIGYHVTVVSPHIHYKSTLHGFVDIYWLHPDHRKGMVGVRLFAEAERSLKELGVKKLFTGTKLHLDASRIFQRLGWTETERLFTKYVGQE